MTALGCAIASGRQNAIAQFAQNIGLAYYTSKFFSQKSLSDK
ncbi:hypothetical protein ACOWPH_00600 [Anabaena sp. PCC 7938]|nr:MULTISPECIES: hypothetical protein [Anabaena]